MAIVGIRSSSIQSVIVSIGTDLLTHMSTGSEEGESNKIGPSVATAKLGRALNFIGTQAAERKLIITHLNRQLSV